MEAARGVKNVDKKIKNGAKNGIFDYIIPYNVGFV